MKLAVVGTGYVGLVTGTCFAETGNEVVCIDIDEAKVAKLKNEQLPIFEPDLEKLFKRNIAESRLQFTTDLKDGIEGAQIIFLALPTPPNEDGSADLSYILAVADQLGPLLQHYTVIVDKSTVPVGTAEQVRSRIAKNAKTEFDVVSNPEFLREGFAVSDFLKPDRVIIGSSSKRAQEVMQKLYNPFTRQGSPLFTMDERSAEMTKYAANSFLAAKISFMNEIANLSERVGADIDAVRQGIGSDERIGNHFLFAGIGFGGSCFPKDVAALLKIGQDHGYDLQILNAISVINAGQKKRLVEKITTYYKGSLSGKRFAMWGLAFKPNTDDIREAPALEIIESLLVEGATVIAFDPEATNNVKRQLGETKNLHFVDHEYKALQDADALIIATEWDEFRTPDFVKVKQLLKHPVIFDGRNLYDLKTMKDQGFYYASIGRQVIKP